MEISAHVSSENLLNELQDLLIWSNPKVSQWIDLFADITMYLNEILQYHVLRLDINVYFQ